MPKSCSDCCYFYYSRGSTYSWDKEYCYAKSRLVFNPLCGEECLETSRLQYFPQNEKDWPNANGDCPYFKKGAYQRWFLGPTYHHYLEDILMREKYRTSQKIEKR